MTRYRLITIDPISSLRAVVAIAMVAFSGVAAATAQRAFVASNGDDLNTAFNCSLVKPCRAFSAAMSVTNDKGEVIVLDSAGYGPVTINQSVSIIAPKGIYGGISVFTGNGVTIGGNNLVVVLRGVTINGQGGSEGIFSSATASELHLDGVSVAGMSLAGIHVVGAGTRLYADDTEVHGNGLHGVVVASGASAYLNRVRARENGDIGLALSGTGSLFVRDSIVERNATGIKAIQGSDPLSQLSTLSVERSRVADNKGNGIELLPSGSGNEISGNVTGSTITHNGDNGVYAECTPSALSTVFVIDTMFTGLDTAYGVLMKNSFCRAYVSRSSFASTGISMGTTGTPTYLFSYQNNVSNRITGSNVLPATGQ